MSRKYSEYQFRETFSYLGKRYDIRANSEKDLAIKMALKKRSLEEGKIVINKNTQVKRYAETWLETYKKDSVGLATYNMYKSNLELHVLPFIGHMRLCDVQKLHIQQILNSRKGHSKSHILKVKQLVQQIFNEAEEADLLSKNPTKNLKLPTCSDGTRRELTEKETKYILDLAETHRSGLWIKTMYYCGLRPQETGTIQWKDVDFKRKRLIVSTAMEAVTDLIKDPKSDAGIREIPIPSQLLESLSEVKSEPSAYIFTQPTTGRRHTKTSMRCLWNSFKRDLNIAMGTKVYRNQLIPPFAVAVDLVPYCLRHTFCTNLQEAGVPINLAKEWMGHEDISTTSKIYTHKSKKAFDDASALYEKFCNNNEEK